jgi:ionotropic glutamate receptor
MKDIESNFYELWKDMTLKQSVSATELAKYAVWEYPLGEHYTDIWKAMSSYKFVQSSKQGMERVFNSTSEEMYAYIHESPMVKYEVYRSCDLTAVGDVFSSKPYGIALQQNSPFTKQVNEM